MKKRLNEKSFGNEAVGARLKKAREAAYEGSIANAAEKLRVHKQNLADQESGRRGMSTFQAAKYARALKVDPWELLSGEKPEGAEHAPTLPETIDRGLLSGLIRSVTFLMTDQETAGNIKQIDIDQAAEFIAGFTDMQSAHETDEKRITRFRQSFCLNLEQVFEDYCAGQPAPRDLFERSANGALAFLQRVYSANGHQAERETA